MTAADNLDLARLSAGLFVEHLGETAPADTVTYAGVAPPKYDWIWRGHPGVIRDATVQHVLVDWVGLEDVAESLWVGYSVEEGSDRYPGLGVLSEQEYEARRQRVLAGRDPLN